VKTKELLDPVLCLVHANHGPSWRDSGRQLCAQSLSRSRMHATHDGTTPAEHQDNTSTRGAPVATVKMLVNISNLANELLGCIVDRKHAHVIRSCGQHEHRDAQSSSTLRHPKLVDSESPCNADIPHSFWHLHFPLVVGSAGVALAVGARRLLDNLRATMIAKHPPEGNHPANTCSTKVARDLYLWPEHDKRRNSVRHPKVGSAVTSPSDRVRKAEVISADR
jgi:hypothetical protein